MLKFITGNKHKLAEVKILLGDQVEQLDVDLPEIQEIDPKQIIEAKLAEALKHDAGPVIVEDVSLHMDCLNGLPGPLIKWFMKAMDLAGIADIAQKMGNDKGSVRCIVGYAANANDIHFFESSIAGRIVPPRGAAGFGWNQIFQSESSDQTWAEIREVDTGPSDLRIDAYGQLKEYLRIN